MYCFIFKILACSLTTYRLQVELCSKAFVFHLIKIDLLFFVLLWCVAHTYLHYVFYCDKMVVSNLSSSVTGIPSTARKPPYVWSDYIRILWTENVLRLEFLFFRLSTNSSVSISSNIELSSVILSHIYQLTITTYKSDVKLNKIT